MVISIRVAARQLLNNSGPLVHVAASCRQHAASVQPGKLAGTHNWKISKDDQA
jgi:hypothetical protein